LSRPPPTLAVPPPEILRAKFLAGLFEDPYVDPDDAEKISGSPEPGSRPRWS
jgi:hypothetical protein